MGEDNSAVVLMRAQRAPATSTNPEIPAISPTFMASESPARFASARHNLLVRPERQASPRRPILRALAADPPLARTGATRTPVRAAAAANADGGGLTASPSQPPMRFILPPLQPPPTAHSHYALEWPTRFGQSQSSSAPLQRQQSNGNKQQGQQQPSDWWTKTSRYATCCFLPVFIEAFNIRGAVAQQAWREKITLCIIITIIMAFVGFFTLGLKATTCSDNDASLANWQALNQTDHQSTPYRDGHVIVMGTVYAFADIANALRKNAGIDLSVDFISRDLSALFMDVNGGPCAPYLSSASSFSNMSFAGNTLLPSACTVPNSFPGSAPLAPPVGSPCPSLAVIDSLSPSGRLFFNWDEVAINTAAPNTLLVFNSAVINLTDFLSTDYGSLFPKENVPKDAVEILLGNLGSDSTLDVMRDYNRLALVRCLQRRYTAGFVGTQSLGCGVYNLVMGVALAVVLGVVFVRFFMALVFHWVVAPRLTTIPSRIGRNDVGYLHPPAHASLMFSGRDTDIVSGPVYGHVYNRSVAEADDLHTIMLVTCYSEGEASIRSTLDSLAGSDYPDTHKLIFVIADGLVKGDGNTKITPDYIIDMMAHDDVLGAPWPQSYYAIAHGSRQHNMAKVYAGQYIFRQRPVPIVLVVKCGTPEERDSGTKKAGNRGKRDSQLILLNFLSRVTFNDRMTALDYDLFYKIQHITGGVAPDKFDLVLMMDADTFVARDALRYMVQAMKNDTRIMGLCGETRIANKLESWVTMIQVYEYFTSHNMGKAFESLFGGVTCLPGCFCMYRVKARKGKNMVPLIVNPDVVEEYSENVVDTLHKKNLLLLGEDRFLSTLMLRSFPKRRMVFVPQAICHTTVPDTFKVLLSQRRRWINSTIHNLLELVLLPDLCGTFCLSMQFVVALELIGTVSLPAAVTLMYCLIFEAMITGRPQALPLVLLAVCLCLPGVLVLITTRKPVYVLWMCVYLVALPVWNFILPLYAFWNFDDFTWGDTRKVEGEGKQSDHSNQHGALEIGSVVQKTWVEWESDKKCGMNAYVKRQQRLKRQMAEQQRREQEMAHRGSTLRRTQSGTNFDVRMSQLHHQSSVESMSLDIPRNPPTSHRRVSKSHVSQYIDASIAFPLFEYLAKASSQMTTTQQPPTASVVQHSDNDTMSHHVHFAPEAFAIPDISMISNMTQSSSSPQSASSSPLPPTLMNRNMGRAQTVSQATTSKQMSRVSDRDNAVVVSDLSNTEPLDPWRMSSTLKTSAGITPAQVEQWKRAGVVFSPLGVPSIGSLQGNHTRYGFGTNTEPRGRELVSSAHAMSSGSQTMTRLSGHASGAKPVSESHDESDRGAPQLQLLSLPPQQGSRFGRDPPPLPPRRSMVCNAPAMSTRASIHDTSAVYDADSSIVSSHGDFADDSREFHDDSRVFYRDGQGMSFMGGVDGSGLFHGLEMNLRRGVDSVLGKDGLADGHVTAPVAESTLTFAVAPAAEGVIRGRGARSGSLGDTEHFSAIATRASLPGSFPGSGRHITASLYGKDYGDRGILGGGTLRSTTALSMVRFSPLDFDDSGDASRLDVVPVADRSGAADSDMSAMDQSGLEEDSRMSGTAPVGPRPAPSDLWSVSWVTAEEAATSESISGPQILLGRSLPMRAADPSFVNAADRTSFASARSQSSAVSVGLLGPRPMPFEMPVAAAKGNPRKSGMR